MRTILGVLICCLSILSCKKNSVDTGGGNPLPPVVDTNNVIPAATPVTAGVMIYLDNITPTNAFSVLYANAYLPYNGFGFNSNGNLTGEKYYTNLVVLPNVDLMGLTPSRIITLSSAVKNYAQLKIPQLTGVGYTTYEYGTATFSLPGGGSIYIPPYAYAPSNGGSVSFNVKVDYQIPSATDYALTMPTLIGDDNGKRYFLDSYGCYIIMLGASDNTGYTIDIKSGAAVMLKIAIPVSLQAGAPDSIAAWNFNPTPQGNKWQKSGYAKKNGNFYERIINKKGYWNFALPVDGTYATLQFRSQADGLPVANTRYKINNGTAEVSQGRTDANGNALIFVPKNKALSVEYRNDHFDTWEHMATTAVTENIGSFTRNESKTITVAGRNDLAVLEGNVYNCDGSVLNGGYALLSGNSPGTGGKDNYIATIANGKFKVAHWINTGGNGLYYVDIYNSSNVLLTRNNVLFTILDMPPGDPTYYSSQNINFYGCANASKLYSNYKIDNTLYMPTGESTDPAPKMTCDYSRSTSVFDVIKITNNGTNISFAGSFGSGYNYLVNQDLVVNGVNCTYDFSLGGNNIFTTRKDANAGGFVEGWFSIRYKDASNVSHTLKGNFRAKRIG